jgi:hypothetical protein
MGALPLSCRRPRAGTSLGAHGAAGAVDFHATTGLDATAITGAQAQLRRRMLRAFVCHLLPDDDAQAMGQRARRPPLRRSHPHAALRVPS